MQLKKLCLWVPIKSLGNASNDKIEGLDKDISYLSNHLTV